MNIARTLNATLRPIAVLSARLAPLPGFRHLQAWDDARQARKAAETEAFIRALRTLLVYRAVPLADEE